MPRVGIMEEDIMNNNYSINNIRKQYLDFYESKQHLVRQSASLIPKNDKSLLLIAAGMAPLKKYFNSSKQKNGIMPEVC